MSEVLFISREQVELIHDASIERFGGIRGLRDEGLLESALGQALATFYYGQGDVFDIAAAYAFHIAQNQPFLDGNKRAALLTALDFLAVNGKPITQPSVEFYDAMIAIAERRMNKNDLAALFRRLANEAKI